MKLRIAASLILFLDAAPAQAIEQNCRFIPAKTEREACYRKQEAELVAKRKSRKAADDTTLQTMQQMRRDDAEVYRSLRSICRGC